MKIWTDGARFFGGQLDRIEQGFKAHGHEIVTDKKDADLLYSNNPWYEKVGGLGSLRPEQKSICTVLDLAPHLGDKFPVAQLATYLENNANAVCTISETVKKDLKERTGYYSTVIYQPIKPIYKMPLTPSQRFPYRALFVGRVNDPNKRSAIGIQALTNLGFKAEEIVTVGSDCPFYGAVWGKEVSDDVLNTLYNSVDFVMFPSRHEGIGLPAIEAMAAGAIPVICNDLSTRHEFFKDISEYDDVNPNPDSITSFMSGFINDRVKMQAFKDKLHRHYVENLAYKMSGVGVADAILKRYEEIKNEQRAN